MLAIEEECWRCFCLPRFTKRCNICLDEVIHFCARKVSIELGCVHIQFFGVDVKEALRITRAHPLALIFIEEIMHLPELALESSGFSGTSASKSIRVDLSKWQVTELEDDLRIILSGYLLDDWVVLFTEWTLVVSVLDKLDAGLTCSFDVVCGLTADGSRGLFAISY
jgi:hypothetical protein